MLVGGAPNFVNCDVKLTVTCGPSEIAELDECPAIVSILIGIGPSAVAKCQSTLPLMVHRSFHPPVKVDVYYATGAGPRHASVHV